MAEAIHPNLIGHRAYARGLAEANANTPMFALAPELARWVHKPNPAVHLPSRRFGSRSTLARLLMPIVKSVLVVCMAIVSTIALGHGGGLDADGCHTNRKTGEYHCHRGGTPKPRALQPIEKHNAQSVVASPSTSRSLPPGCYVGPRGGTYTITKSGRKNYGGC